MSMPNETIAGSARMNADVAHDDYMRSQGNGSHDPAFTACIMERDRLRQQNAELVRALGTLNAAVKNVTVTSGGKVYRDLSAASGNADYILATVQS